MRKGWILLIALLLALGSALSLAAPAEAAKSTRAAQVAAVEGDAHITKNGGTKEFRLFKGMTLHQGDYLVTGPGAKVVLIIADREDEVTIGEHASLYISELTGTAEGSKSKFKMWAGSLWNKVKSLVGADDEFEVETPTAVMGVRGTQFFVAFDPATGKVTVTTAAGIVQAGPKGAEGETRPPAILLPLRTFQWFDEAAAEDPNENVTVVDLEAFFAAAGPDIVEKMILETPQLLEEVRQLQELAQQDPSIGEPPNPEDVANVFTHLVRESINRGVLPEERTEQLLSTVNASIADPDARIDLNRDVPPVEHISGADPEREQRKKEQLQQAEQRQREKREQQQRAKLEIAEEKELPERAREQRQQQEEAKQEAEAERRQQAAESYKEQLTEEERQQLEERMQERELEREEQQQAAEAKRPPAADPEEGDPGGSGGSPGGGGTAPQPGGPDDGPRAIVTLESTQSETVFHLIIALKNATNLFAFQLDLGVPYDDAELLVENVESIAGPMEALFNPARSAANMKREPEVLIGSDMYGEGLSVAAMMLPGEEPVHVEEETLLIIPLDLRPSLDPGNPDSPKSELLLYMELILVDGEGNRIQTGLPAGLHGIPIPAAPDEA